MEQLNKIDWEKMDNLIPVITQDSKTNEVLMLAYMNKEALELTIKTNYAHYFSRSKQRIWKKGESSNHLQEIVEILVDCDNDTLLLKVKSRSLDLEPILVTYMLWIFYQESSYINLMLIQI